MIVFRQSGDYSDSGCTRAKVVVIGQDVVVFGQIRLYSDKRGVFQAKFLYFRKIANNRAKWMYSGKICCFMAKWLYSGKSGCIRLKWL